MTFKTHSLRALAAALLSCGLIASFGAGAQSLPHAAGETPVEARNHALVLEFYERFFNQHDLTAATDLIRPDYIQHNPNIATGRQAFVDFFTKTFTQTPQSQTTVVRSAAEGDLVWVHHHPVSVPQTPGVEIIDIYRIQDGKIAEHWDAVTPVSATPANDNTQF